MSDYLNIKKTLRPKSRKKLVGVMKASIKKAKKKHSSIKVSLKLETKR